MYVKHWLLNIDSTTLKWGDFFICYCIWMVAGLMLIVFLQSSVNLSKSWCHRLRSSVVSCVCVCVCVCVLLLVYAVHTKIKFSQNVCCVMSLQTWMCFICGRKNKIFWRNSTKQFWRPLTSIGGKNTNAHTNTHTHAHTDTDTHTHARSHAHTRTQTHTHAHTHTHISLRCIQSNVLKYNNYINKPMNIWI